MLAELTQYLFPEAVGPSSKTWPWCPPQLEQTISTRTIPWVRPCDIQWLLRYFDRN